MKRLALSCFLLFVVAAAWGQTTYTWNVSSGAWTASGSWSPARTSPATDDVLVFDGTSIAAPVVTDIPYEAIGRLRIINGASVTFASSDSVVGAGTISRSATNVTGTGTSFLSFFSPNDFIVTSTSTMHRVVTVTSDGSLTTAESGTLTNVAYRKAAGLYMGGASPAFEVESGSSLTVSAAATTRPMILFMKSGATASINGSLTFTGTTHKIDAADSSAITVNSGGVVTQGTGCTGNVLTANGTAGVMSFASGSKFVSLAGSNPFGLTAPSSKVVFQTGSLYSQQQTTAPALSNRTYANFELDGNVTANVGTNFTQPWTVDQVEIKSGSTLQMASASGTGSANLNIKGNLIVDGTLFFGTGSAIKYTINLTGTTPQAISGAGTITLGDSLAAVVINNASGVALQRSLTLPCPLTLTNGILTLGANDLILGPAATIGGSPSASAMVVTNGTGQMIKRYADQTVSTPVSFTFPVGDHDGTSEYSPATVALNAGSVLSTAQVGVRTVNAKHPNNSSATDFIDRYWTLSSSGVSSASYDALFTYADGDIHGTESVLTGGKYSGSWSATGLVNAGTNTVTFTGESSFSDFTAGEAGVLPVAVTSFAAAAFHSGVAITWTTATETDNVGFEVERRAVNSDQRSMGTNHGWGVSGWVKVGFVAGAGTGTSPREYSFTDAPPPGRYAYRLKQVDRSGRSAYVGEAEVLFGAAPNVFALSEPYPNPFNPSTTLEFTLSEDEFVSLKVFNVLGEEVATLFNGVAKAGIVNRTIFDGTNLTSGIYFYRLQSDRQVVTRRMMLIQ
jgi:hypothetical protein